MPVATLSTCARCGTALPGPAAGPGHCPRCVLRGVLDAEGDDAPDMVGAYELRSRIGEGGYGEVWKAWDTRLARFVAVKRMKRADAGERRRFLTEARLAAGLSHPHVAAVHEVGETADEVFLAMALVAGGTLRDLVEREPAARAPRTIVTLVRDAARGVAAAHERNVVHCDLKPENLLVEKRGDGWHVFVTDFGLARQARPGLGATLSGVAGTPSYMAPEQVAGSRVDARTDVYGLGATLYALLVRRPPFLGDSPAQVLAAITSAEPAPPRRFEPSLDRELETIVLKCLDKEPSRRYASAHDVADDLDRWLESRPILARPPGFLYRAHKALRRRRAVAATAALGAVALAALSAWLVPRLFRAERSAALWTDISVILSDADALARAGETSRARAKLDEGVAVCQAALARGELPHARYFLGRLHRARGDRARARSELDAALEADPGLVEARFERGLLSLDEYSDGLDAALESLGSRVGSGDYREHALTDRAEALVPRLAELRTAALRDLSPGVGRSRYCRPADALYGQAEVARLQRDAAAAHRGLEQALAADPIHVPALISLSNLYIRPFERYDDALGLADRAVRVHRGNAAALASRSRISLWVSRLRPFTEDQKRLVFQALEDALRAREIGPVTSTSWLLSAAARMDAGDLEGARVDYEESRRLNPASAVACDGLGRVHFAAARHADAILAFDAALKLDPQNPWALFNRGLARRGLREYDTAAGDFTAVMDLQPLWVEPVYERGETRRLAGELDGALEDFEAALESSQSEWQAWRGKGLILGARSDRSGSVESLQKALSLMHVDHPSRPIVERELAEAESR